MSFLISYLEDTGEICSCSSGIKQGSKEADIIIQMDNNSSYLWSETASNCIEHWINAGEMVDKIPFTLTVNGAVVSNVPVNSQVLWPDGEITIETDGTIEIESNITGTFSLAISHVEYLKTTIEVEYNG
tara:strand:+ start:83 stop:469 length:387 start_codon:yes stop_codon:yes gene_type:complete